MPVTRTTTATPSQVWSVLAQGWDYAGWVVGASRIRGVDNTWPQPGSKISHSVGPWPAMIDDNTVVEAATPEKELILLAKVWPVAAARITMRLHEIPEGTRIEMSESAVSKPFSWIPQPVQSAALWRRNHECLLRLALIAEGRESDGDS